jgi:hypothetical protein
MAVTELLPLPVQKQTVKRSAQCPVLAQQRQTGAPTINIQSSLRTAPICVQMSHGNSYTVCMSVYTHVLYSVETDGGGAKGINSIWEFGTAVNAACEGNLRVP